MLRAKVNFLSLIALALVFSSCKDDENYVPISIQALEDSIEVEQDTSIDIDVLFNDGNIPSNGTLTVSNLQNGSAVVIDPNNTPEDPSDDMIRYTPNTNYYGVDTFTYGICNAVFPISCASASVTVTVTPISPVNFDINQVPYQTLSEYNFFEGTLADLNPVYGVLPYDLNSPLFSDYAHKKRFIWMPSNVKAAYVSDYTPLDFPTGAILIKNFYYDNVLPNDETKIIETRLMIKMEGEWSFAKYVWNDEQTEAFFTNDGSFVPIDWVQDNQTKSVNYRVPSVSECFTCHNKFGTPVPIGPKPQNLNRELIYSDGIQNQLSKWVTQGYLENDFPANIETTVAWDDLSQSLDLRARSYIDINCAHCHRPGGFVPDFLNTDYRYETPLEDSNIVENKEDIASRFNSVVFGFSMPLLGRTIVHQEGLDLLTEYLDSL